MKIADQSIYVYNPLLRALNDSNHFVILSQFLFYIVAILLQCLCPLLLYLFVSVFFGLLFNILIELVIILPDPLQFLLFRLPRTVYSAFSRWCQVWISDRRWRLLEYQDVSGVYLSGREVVSVTKADETVDETAADHAKETFPEKETNDEYSYCPFTQTDRFLLNKIRRDEHRFICSNAYVELPEVQWRRLQFDPEIEEEILNRGGSRGNNSADSSYGAIECKEQSRSSATTDWVCQNYIENKKPRSERGFNKELFRNMKANLEGLPEDFEELFSDRFELARKKNPDDRSELEYMPVDRSGLRNYEVQSKGKQDTNCIDSGPLLTMQKDFLVNNHISTKLNNRTNEEFTKYLRELNETYDWVDQGDCADIMFKHMEWLREIGYMEKHPFGDVIGESVGRSPEELASKMSCESSRDNIHDDGLKSNNATSKVFESYVPRQSEFVLNKIKKWSTPFRTKLSIFANFFLEFIILPQIIVVLSFEKFYRRYVDYANPDRYLIALHGNGSNPGNFVFGRFYLALYGYTDNIIHISYLGGRSKVDYTGCMETCKRDVVPLIREELGRIVKARENDVNRRPKGPVSLSFIGHSLGGILSLEIADSIGELLEEVETPPGIQGSGHREFKLSRAHFPEGNGYPEDTPNACTRSPASTQSTTHCDSRESTGTSCSSAGTSPVDSRNANYHGLHANTTAVVHETTFRLHALLLVSAPLSGSDFIPLLGNTKVYNRQKTVDTMSMNYLRYQFIPLTPKTYDLRRKIKKQLQWGNTSRTFENVHLIAGGCDYLVFPYSAFGMDLLDGDDPAQVWSSNSEVVPHDRRKNQIASSGKKISPVELKGRLVHEKTHHVQVSESMSGGSSSSYLIHRDRQREEGVDFWMYEHDMDRATHSYFSEDRSCNGGVQHTSFEVIGNVGHYNIAASKMLWRCVRDKL